MGFVGSMVGAAVGNRVSGKAQDGKEWLGRFWAIPTSAAHAGLLTGAYKLFGENAKLAQDLAVAPTLSFIVALGAGWAIDKLFDDHEKAEKVFMALAIGGVSVGGAAVALAMQGEAHIDGIQSGVGAVPVGEALLIASSNLGAATLGMIAGEALHKDEPSLRRG